MAEEFGTFITARRRELELTLGDVATELDVSPITVSNWSNGQSLPDTDQLGALAALLDVPAEDLTRLAGPEVAIPTPEVESPEIDIPTPEVESPEIDIPAPESDVPEIAVPPVDAPEAAERIEMAEPEAAVDASEIDEELAEMMEEQSVEVEVPAFVETPPEPAPAPPRRRAQAATAPRVATALPVTYIEDPKQLMRYRIRWGITVAALVVMFLILLWATGGLISALSDIKESVTPGGGS